MLSASYTTSKNDTTFDQTSLQLMTDNLLCGKTANSIDKKYHPLIVPYLQKAKNEAIATGNQGLETKINRIMNHLTLSSPKKTPTKKRQQTPKRNKTSPSITMKTTIQKDYSQYNDEVDQLMNNKKTFSEIESKNYTPIQLCIQQHRDEASKSQDYQVAKKYHNEYLSFSNYIRTLPKPKRHYGDEEYINKLKYKYCQAIKYYQDLEERLNNESDQLDQSEQQITMDTLTAIQEEDDKFDQEETDIINCKDFHPSSFLMNLRKTERKCAKAFMYDEAELRLKYGNELENLEKNNYIQKKRYELADKKLRAKRDRQKQNELTEDQNAIKNELFQLKRNRLLRIAQAEIDATKQKIEELGDQVPNESEMILYSYLPIDYSQKKTKSSIKFSRGSKSDSNLSNPEILTQTEISPADDSVSQRSSQLNTNTNISSDGSTSINLEDDNSQRLRQNFNSSKVVLIGTPNSRSIADLTLIRKDSDQNVDTRNSQHGILRDKSTDYEFVLEENEEEDIEKNQNEIPIYKGQIESSQRSILTKNKDKFNNIVINKAANIKEDSDSIYLSDSMEFDQQSEEDNKTTRLSLSYQKFLTPNQESNKKKPRERLQYDQYLRSPKPSTISNVSLTDDSFQNTSNIYNQQRSESSATEIAYCSVSEKTNSYYPSEYYNYNNYYSEGEEEEEEEEYIKRNEADKEYSYNYFTGDGLDS